MLLGHSLRRLSTPGVHVRSRQAVGDRGWGVGGALFPDYGYCVLLDIGKASSGRLVIVLHSEEVQTPF